jgi:hypothetical protein
MHDYFGHDLEKLHIKIDWWLSFQKPTKQHQFRKAFILACIRMKHSAIHNDFSWINSILKMNFILTNHWIKTTLLVWADSLCTHLEIDWSIYLRFCKLLKCQILYPHRNSNLKLEVEQSWAQNYEANLFRCKLGRIEINAVIDAMLLFNSSPYRTVQLQEYQPNHQSHN